MSNTAYSLFSEVLEGYLAAVAVEIHSAVCRGIAMGWQCVVGAACVVAGTLAGIFPKEHTSCVDYLLRKLGVRAGLQYEMLRGIGV